jgi:hypothetical protein
LKAGSQGEEISERKQGHCGGWSESSVVFRDRWYHCRTKGESIERMFDIKETNFRWEEIHAVFLIICISSAHPHDEVPVSCALRCSLCLYSSVSHCSRNLNLPCSISMAGVTTGFGRKSQCSVDGRAKECKTHHNRL